MVNQHSTAYSLHICSVQDILFVVFICALGAEGRERSRRNNSVSVCLSDDEANTHLVYVWGYFHSAEEEDTEPVGGQMCVGGGWQSSD